MHDPREVLDEARRELARLPALIDALTAGMDERTWCARPAADEWSALEIVCHLRDEETDDFGARLRVVVEGGQEFAPIDPPRWALERRYREAVPREAVAALVSRREGSLARLRALDPETLIRGVEHPRIGRLSGLDLVVAWVAHDRLHLQQLAGTLARVWADRWAPLRTEYAGPIPYGAPASSG